MQNNIFLNSGDPLLGTTSNFSHSFDDEIARFDRAQQALEQRKQEMMQARAQASQPEHSRTPVWDEIDRITSDLSDRDYEYINGNEEFQQSNRRIMALLQREYMKVMRPIVEGTKDGKDALNNHLELVKRLRKEASNRSDKEMDLFREYTENYSDKTFAEFMEMKKKNINKK